MKTTLRKYQRACLRDTEKFKKDWEFFCIAKDSWLQGWNYAVRAMQFTPFNKPQEWKEQMATEEVDVGEHQSWRGFSSLKVPNAGTAHMAVQKSRRDLHLIVEHSIARAIENNELDTYVKLGKWDENVQEIKEELKRLGYEVFHNDEDTSMYISW